MSKRLAWLALLLLVPLSEAFAINPSSSRHLSQRAITDFTFASGNGECSSQQKTQINTWLDDIAMVADKAVEKLRLANSNRNVAFTLKSLLGVTPTSATPGQWSFDSTVIRDLTGTIKP